MSHRGLRGSNAVDARAEIHEHRKVLAATLVGTAIEWYDYFIYAQAAGLALGPLFFAPIAKDNPSLAQLLSFATIGISFLFRPLGALVCGHLGDRLGRKTMLVLTLVLMGISTAAIGLLPTYALAGTTAPTLLILLRVLQGFSAGGEWGGAALMAVEHAPAGRRGLYGSFPQTGVPLGMILATLVLLLLNVALGKDQFAAWGWRLPFLLSIVLIVVGFTIRRSLEESPVFSRMQQRQRDSFPLKHLFRDHSGAVLRAALICVANNAAGYLLIAFFISYGQKALHLPSGQVLLSCTVASAGWLVFTLLGGILADRIGRVRTFQLGYVLLMLWAVPMWFLIDAARVELFFLATLVLALPLGLTYGPQAALFAEAFPAKVRYSGASVAYALGSILGGAFAATIAQWIIDSYGKSWLIGGYLIGLCMVSLAAVSSGRDPMGIDLEVANDDRSSQSWVDAKPRPAVINRLN